NLRGYFPHSTSTIQSKKTRNLSFSLFLLKNPTIPKILILQGIITSRFMRKLLLLLVCLCVNQSLFAQAIYEDFSSKKLGETRKLKIQLPRNYETNTEKRYPIVLVLDGDYLFEPVAGNVDYFSYWEDMPESIVVGIVQGNSRYDDCDYDSQNFVPEGKGADFFEFIGLELIPHIDKKYRTAKFIIGVGHDFTANFLNYYLFKNPPLL